MLSFEVVICAVEEGMEDCEQQAGFMEDLRNDNTAQRKGLGST